MKVHVVRAGDENHQAFFASHSVTYPVKAVITTKETTKEHWKEVKTHDSAGEAVMVIDGEGAMYHFSEETDAMLFSMKW